MSFFYGFADELVKLSFSLSDIGLSASDVKGMARPVAKEHGRGVGKGAIEEAAKKVGPSIAGAAVGGLAGKALLRRGALGALLGLGVVHRKKLKESAQEAMRSKK